MHGRRGDLEAFEHALDVFERRLGRPPRKRGGFERPLHAGICRDDRAAQIRIAAQVVERLVERAGERLPLRAEDRKRPQQAPRAMHESYDDHSPD